MGSGMQTEVSLDVCKIFAGVIRRPLDIPGSETGGLVHSVKVREVPSDIWVTFTFSEGLKQNAFSSLEPPQSSLA